MGASQPDDGEVLAEFCASFQDLAAIADRIGQSDKFGEVVLRVRNGEQVTPLLPDLGIPLEQSLDIPLERSAAPSSARGRGPGPMTTVPGVVGHSAEEVYRCPEGRCRRAARREPGGPVPRCEVYGQPMRLPGDKD